MDAVAERARMWSSVAPAWREHASFVDRRSAVVTDALLRRSAPRPGERVLELACGPGGVALAAAPLVAPHGEVVASDVAPEMAAIAAARAAEAGLANVTARALALDAIAEPDAAYDVVLCRYGLMFAADPVAAAGEIRRVLRPGGRLSLATWGSRERNPWLGLVLDLVSARLGRPVPPPGVPGPFSLPDLESVEAVLRAGGLTELQVEELDVPVRTASVDDWWRRTLALAGPLAGAIADLGPEAVRELRAHATEVTRPYLDQEGLWFPGVSIVATGRAPRG